LEDGIPIRPVGLCNVNNLFELNLERAESVEVLRGPGSALHGSNALHGALNARMPFSADDNHLEFAWLLGEQEYQRIDLGWQSIGEQRELRLDATLQSSGSFRQDEGFDQQKINLRLDQHHPDVDVSYRFAVTNLNQETAGFILGFESYKDPALRTGNLNPEAYRDAWSARASSRWSFDREDWNHQLTPFLRSSRMAFLQHFLPGKPLEENGQDSLGLQWLSHREGRISADLGFDLEWADIELREFQDRPVAGGSAFLRETRPTGLHYDYQVNQKLIALHGAMDWSLNPRWNVRVGLRFEHLEYQYDNQTLDGNTRDDGTVCGFGGCLHTRPADRNDSFTEWAPKLMVSYRPAEKSLAWARLSRGFRAPQTSELYRLQDGQTVSDLSPESIAAAELGYRKESAGSHWSASVYYMHKSHFIFRDADGFNVSDGATRHRGVEWSYATDIATGLSLNLAMSYSRHSYAFSRDAARGERIEAGNQVDTAPEWLGRAGLDWRPAEGRKLRAEWVHQGGYFLDAANEHEYGGHDLLHLTWSERWSAHWSVDVQLENLLDRRYAQRADFAFGNYRYFPGEGRRITLALRYRR
jgi:outer membrane receptor protein involved in Fe transport